MAASNEAERLVTCGCGYHNNRPITYAKYRGMFKNSPNGISPPASAPQLEKYFSSAGRYGVAYIACDACITDDCRPYFTHHPNGWKLKLGDPKSTDKNDYFNFEPLKNL